MVRLSARQLLMLRLLTDGPRFADVLEPDVPNAFRTLRSLARLGLAQAGPNGWRLTEAGRQAIAARSAP